MANPIKPKRKKKALLTFVATCGAGLEELVAGEIREQGGQNTVINPGAVSWAGNLEAGYKLCLWSRYASRILLQIAQFDAPDPDTLYRQAGKIDWDEHFSSDTTFAVFSTITDSPIGHSKYAALRVKDAIADQFRSRTGRRPTVDTNQPGIRINLHLRGQRATLAVDLSGESLHRRGYRLETVEAPLKETLAAGIIHLCGFTNDFQPDGVLLDPMCGSGTLLIEAAMIFGDTAPGLQRKKFGFMYWNRHDPRLWEKLVSEAVQREEEGLQKPWPQFIGYDANPLAVKAARQNILAAGLEDRIEVSQRQLAALERPADRGMLVINPPYGERLSDKEEIKYLYRCIDRKVGQELYGWQIGFFSSNPDLAGNLNLNWSDSFRLFNGAIKCRLHRGTAEKTSDKVPSLPQLHQLPPGKEGEDFAVRLAKNCRQLFPWAQKENISCFRIYDADIPEYNLAVDLYGNWVMANEYPAPATVDRKKAQHLFNVALQVVREVLTIPHSRVFIHKTGAIREKGKHPKSSGKNKIFEVLEQQCHFLVSFTDYHGTGLTLDQRTIRITLGKLAAGKTFLNLFGGTGTATVHTLINNALATTTVDPSAVLLQRARANFALNGFGGPQHMTVQDDCLKWLGRCQSRYGLILVNQPAAGVDRQGTTSFHVQKDHEQLLRLAMKRLTREGLLVFVTGHPKFHLAAPLQEEFDIREITEQLIPADFTQSRNMNRCWEFRHRQQNKEP